MFGPLERCPVPLICRAYPIEALPGNELGFPKLPGMNWDFLKISTWNELGLPEEPKLKRATTWNELGLLEKPGLK
jgi:hypothetical protein